MNIWWCHIRKQNWGLYCAATLQRHAKDLFLYAFPEMNLGRTDIQCKRLFSVKHLKPGILDEQFVQALLNRINQANMQEAIEEEDDLAYLMYESEDDF